VSENSEVARNKEENQTVLTPGGELQRPREPVGGLAGRHSRSPLVTRNKHSDCPQNPEHLRWRDFSEMRTVTRISQVSPGFLKSAIRMTGNSQR
jgi:hypothetical protein